MTGHPRTRRPLELDEARELTRVVERLIADFCPPLTAPFVQQVVAETTGTWAGAPVRRYVALLTERVARRKLVDARSNHSMGDDVHKTDREDRTCVPALETAS
jgi:hypothetical protein